MLQRRVGCNVPTLTNVVERFGLLYVQVYAAPYQEGH